MDGRMVRVNSVCARARVCGCVCARVCVCVRVCVLIMRVESELGARVVIG